MSRIRFIAEGTISTVASGNVTPGEPAGVRAGDLIVVCIAARGNVAFTNPAGAWVTVNTQQSSGNTSTTATTAIASGHMAYIIRGASAPSYTFTRTLGDLGHGKAFAFRGVNQASPLDNSVAVTLAANATAVTTGSGWTPSVEHCLYVMFGAAGDNALWSSWAASGGGGWTAWTEQEDTSTTTGADSNLGVAYAFNNSRTAITAFTVTQAANSRHVIFAAGFKPEPRPYEVGLLGVGRN